MTDQDRRFEAARRYAAANASDPWALPRALAHIRNGIASHFTQDGKDAFYNADPFQETRMTASGKEYVVTVYRNMIRP
jgi:hypothetical protein